VAWIDGLARRRPRRRRDVATPRDVADWCDALARRIRSGSTVGAALGSVVPTDAVTARATGPMRLAFDRGRSAGDALTLVGRAGPHLHLAIAVLGTVARLGGPSAQAIDAVAVTLRQRADDDDARAVQAAQARLSAHVMTALPLLMLGLFVTGDPDVRSTMTTPVGALCLVFGLGLNASGWWWMRRIVRGAS
jgi:tight adherence protein B